MNAPKYDRNAFPALVNEAMTAYVAWREESVLVRDAYRGWHAAPSDERRFAFARYRNALEREEHAAIGYARVLACAADVAWAA